MVATADHFKQFRPAVHSIYNHRDWKQAPLPGTYTQAVNWFEL